MSVDNRTNEKSTKGGDMMTMKNETQARTAGHCNQCIMPPMGKVTVVRDFTDINGSTRLIGTMSYQIPTYPMIALCDEHMATHYTAFKPYFGAWVKECAYARNW